MNWDQIGAIAELLGALGVICSVLYLAVQIRSEKGATLANTRQLRQNGVREIMIAVADSEHLAPIFAKMGEPTIAIAHLMDTFQLNREEALRVNNFYVAMLRQLETNLRMDMTDDELQQTLETVRVQLRGPMGAWWKNGKHLFSEPFVRRVDELIRNVT